MDEDEEQEIAAMFADLNVRDQQIIAKHRA